MQIPGLTKSLIWWGIGAVLLLAIMASHGPVWLVSSKAEEMAKRRANEAVVAALAPVCVDKFKRAPDASANLVALKKIASGWNQDEFIAKGGWATMPGSDAPNLSVAKACADMLTGR